MQILILANFRQFDYVLEKLFNLKHCANFEIENSLDAGIQDKSTSISIVVKFEEMSESDDGDESDKHI